MYFTLDGFNIIVFNEGTRYTRGLKNMAGAKSGKKGGGLAAIAPWAFESEGNAADAAPAPKSRKAVPLTPSTVAPGATPQSAPSQSAPPLGAFSTLAAAPVSPPTSPQTSGMTSFINTQPAGPDPQALGIVESAVYVNFDDGRGGQRPSRFMAFMKMYGLMGRPADINSVLGALQITDPSFTAEAVASDARAHLTMLDQFERSIADEHAAEVQNRVGSKDAEAASIQEANAKDQGEIERLTKAISERSARLPILAQERSEGEAAIARSTAKMATAQDAVRAALTSTLSLFTPKSA